MPWPPREGELLPRFNEPEGIEEKLRDYSLVLDHKDGGSKANGFLTMLAIDLTAIEYLDRQIRIGIASNPISEVRPDGLDRYGCAVDLRIAGIGRYSQRKAWVRTGWRLDGPDARPRLSTAIPTGKRRKRK